VPLLPQQPKLRQPAKPSCPKAWQRLGPRIGPFTA